MGDVSPRNGRRRCRRDARSTAPGQPSANYERVNARELSMQGLCRCIAAEGAQSPAAAAADVTGKSRGNSSITSARKRARRPRDATHGIDSLH